MGSSVIRNLIGILALIVLSFLIGITAADSAKSAVIVIFATIGIIAIIAMGKYVWVGLFILIPIAQVIPIHDRYPAYLFIAALILVYWCVLVFLGRSHFTWRKLVGADILVSLFIFYMAITFFRFPASNTFLAELFSHKLEHVSVSVYPLCFLVPIFYLAYSCIPVDNSHFIKTVKWGAIIKLVLLFIFAAHSIITSTASSEESTRISGLAQFSECLCVFAYASIAQGKLLTSPHLLFVVASFTIALASGYRKTFLYLAYLCFCISIIKREYTTILITLLIGILSLLFISSSNIIDQLPYTVQRSLSIIPGINVRQSVKQSGTNSTNWRIEMWRWALNPKTRFIDNYIAGDGFYKDAKESQRIQRFSSTGKANKADQYLTVKKRLWHSGFIATLQEIGIIGVALTLIFYTYAFIKVFRIGYAIRNKTYFKYFIFYTFPYIYSFIRFYFQTANTEYFLLSLSHMGFLKAFYSFAIERGDIVPDRKRRYTPQLIQQMTPSGLST